MARSVQKKYENAGWWNKFALPWKQKGMFWKSILNDIVLYNRIEPELYSMKFLTTTQITQTGLNIGNIRF